jgi:hypothetical protein
MSQTDTSERRMQDAPGSAFSSFRNCNEPHSLATFVVALNVYVLCMHCRFMNRFVRFPWRAVMALSTHVHQPSALYCALG